jgi:hypothetical protein
VTHTESIPPGESAAALLPEDWEVSAVAPESPAQAEVIGQTIAGIMHMLAELGSDLRSLDGITLATDCKQTASEIQQLRAGEIPLEAADLPESLDLGRTVPVWRGGELRFHIVLRASLGVMAISGKKKDYELAVASLAHEAAHVEHEGHLYRQLPQLRARPLECGNRSRAAFIKALDTWSEYSASRSSAMFRPGALQDFDSVFSKLLRQSVPACRAIIASCRKHGITPKAFLDLQQLFGDLFIRAGYLLGHLHGLEWNLDEHAPRAAVLLEKRPEMRDVMARLGNALHLLWLTEYAWDSIEVFAPVYDLLLEAMELYGLSFHKNNEEYTVKLLFRSRGGRA